MGGVSMNFQLYQKECIGNKETIKIEHGKKC